MIDFCILIPSRRIHLIWVSGYAQVRESYRVECWQAQSDHSPILYILEFSVSELNNACGIRMLECCIISRSHRFIIFWVSELSNKYVYMQIMIVKSDFGISTALDLLQLTGHGGGHRVMVTLMPRRLAG